MKYIKSERSNNEMDTSKLEHFCEKYSIELMPIQDSINRALQRRHFNIVD
jgi:hypothetical protein